MTGATSGAGKRSNPRRRGAWRRGGRRGGLRGGLLRNREGSAVIEFAFIAPVFFMMMFALLELGMVFVVDSVLANATFESGRLVRTGQVSAASMTRAQFKTSLCSRMSVFASDCEDRVSIDVRVIPSFTAPLPDPMENGETFDESKLEFNYGTYGDLVLVRAWYRQPLVTTYLRPGLSRLQDGTARLMSTTAFRNEPA